MPRQNNQARAAIAGAGEKVSELAWTVGRDARKEARLQRRWWVLQTALGVALTLFARRLAERVWIVATGEEPPVLGHAGEPAKELGDNSHPHDPHNPVGAGEPAPPSASSSANAEATPVVGGHAGGTDLPARTGGGSASTSTLPPVSAGNRIGETEGPRTIGGL